MKTYLLFPICLLICCCSANSANSFYNLETAYGNNWFAPGPSTGAYENYFSPVNSTASTAVYHGHSLGNTNNIPPGSSVSQLQWSSFGMAVEGLRPDVSFGELIEPPAENINTNEAPWNFEKKTVGDNSESYWECLNPAGGAFWSPSTKQIFAAQPNIVEIHWRTLDGGTNIQQVMVGAIPEQRPVRLFWTEDPYDAPTVNLDGKFPVIHYNSEVREPVYELTTNMVGGTEYVNSNMVSGVMLDDQKRLRAVNTKGMFLLEYYETGTYDQQVQPVGIEIVQVMEPDLTVQRADIGSRLYPKDTYWSRKEGLSDLDADVTSGLHVSAYRFDHVGPKDGAVYAIKNTMEDPWSLEVYWRHKGVMDVLWPFERDWYRCDWPEHPQLRVVAPEGEQSPPILFPNDLNAKLMDYMDPPLHATLAASGKSLNMSEPGLCLMKYSTNDDIWFDAIKSVVSTNTTYFDLNPVDWDIGDELRPPGTEAHAMRFDGETQFVNCSRSWLNEKTDWTLSLWFQTEEIKYSALYSEADSGGVTFEVSVTDDGGIGVALFNRDISGNWVHFDFADGVIEAGKWHYLAVTLEDGGDPGGTLTVYLDGQSWSQNDMRRENHRNYGQKGCFGAAYSKLTPTNFFKGRLDQTRIWNEVLTAEQIENNKYELTEDVAGALIADYAFDEGSGSIIHNKVGGYHGTTQNEPTWCFGQVEPQTSYSVFPGFVYLPTGSRYNIDKYGYPTVSNFDEKSYVFPINKGLLEVWWANRSKQEGMPAVYYPSWVNRYSCSWPDEAPEIVIASGLGSGGDQPGETDGALLFDGLDDAITFPDDSHLNFTNAFTIEAWVKVDALSTNPVGIVSKQSDLELSGYSLVLSGDTVVATVLDEQSNLYKLSGGTVASNVWTHVAFSYAVNCSMEGYVNARPIAFSGASTSAVKNASSHLVIGSGTVPEVGSFNGAIGEIRLWNKVLSRREIAERRMKRLDGTEEGLVALYRCQEAVQKDILTDSGPNGINGSIMGGEWGQPGRPIGIAGGYSMSDDSIYYQNDSAKPGFNPNEEHALVVGGTAYALRNDLNDLTSTNSSECYVLVDYLDPDTARPKMQLFTVVETNEQYAFEYLLEAGLPIQPPMPLAALPPCVKTDSSTKPPAWPDRKHEWWAASAGDDGRDTNVVMRFYYQMQPGFWFPELSITDQPANGTELPWLCGNAPTGTPVSINYTVSWPDNPPKIKIGQTLTYASHGLPDLWNQSSIASIYQQSAQNGMHNCVALFDPVRDRSQPLSINVIHSMEKLNLASKDLTDSWVRFPKLPPSLYSRLYYDPDRGSEGELVLKGIYEQTLTGDGYLLLNALNDIEKTLVRDAASGITNDLKVAWNTAVNQLEAAPWEIKPNESFVRGAAYAGTGTGAGYVTLAFNNSTNESQVAESAPISLSILEVVPELAGGEMEVIEPNNPLDEQLSLRCSLDFGGHVDDFNFEWRFADPEGGLIPNTNFISWAAYTQSGSSSLLNEASISGASLFTMLDHYYAFRYQKLDPSGPTGTNWSEWVYNLGPGWVTRVMNGVNPYEQVMQDRLSNAVDTRSTMISLAGEPYEGDIALTLEGVNDSGLIPVYQKVLNRALDFSIDAQITNENANATLLYAATRLHDLYMLLGNEAFSDAQDPSVAFPSALDDNMYGGDATGQFAFMNQVPNLLEEELALLRGRDDTLAPSVKIAPIFNRLTWNFTKGVNGGESAYAFNYNIVGDPGRIDGSISAADAKALYPQGHGDAWGHYLSAVSGYYRLLSSEYYGWQTTPGSTLVGNVAVSTDFFDEQKFAEAAAAKARTGVEIVELVHRQAYQAVSTEKWSNYRDEDPERAWGMAGWSSRAGQGALYDWATANSLLVDSLTNLTQIGQSDAIPEGIQKIDRTTTPELQEIAAGMKSIQESIDHANSGLNPMGLANNVVPFDISPAEIDQGKTHFEQIYERALEALYNACVAFDYSRNINAEMRKQFDSLYDLQEQLAQNEMSYHNRLIALYGKPYPDDCGPEGTYPQEYEGPDLINWQILDMEDFVSNPPTGQTVSVKIYDYDFNITNTYETYDKYKDYISISTNVYKTNTFTGTTSFSIADSGLKVKPTDWSGRRAAQGELQLALLDMVKTWYSLEASIADYNVTLAALDTELDHLKDDYKRYSYEWGAVSTNLVNRVDSSKHINGLEIGAQATELAAEAVATIVLNASEGIPKEIEGITGVYVENNLGTGVAVAATVAKYIGFFAAQGMEIGAKGWELQQELWDIELEETLSDNEYQDILHWRTREALAMLKQQYVKRAEVFEQLANLQQMTGRVGKLLQDGESLLNERAQVRARAAQRVQMGRYSDASFRIFRDDALRRYNATFDLAARYVYLAARAYDYETGLLESDTQYTPGSKFLEDIVRARMPGRFFTWLGEPQVGGSEGDPGLADIMARMKANWDVAKGRFGFNNPETETSRFSLRTELWRISPLSETNWVTKLETCKVDNLYDMPEFVRNCIPFSDLEQAEPALVIEFSSKIKAGENFFGNDLAGGDNAYDPSHQATKIRSAGVWLSGYNITYNTATNGAGLANEPRVYLLPVGEDIMRSPTSEGLELRNWKVMDQALPIPYPIGDAELSDPDFLPVVDSLSEPLAGIRRFASMRAYHDRGQFDESETHNNGRLVGRSVWNTRWMLIIPGRLLHSDPVEGIERLIHGAETGGVRNGDGITDIKIFFQTYSVSGS